MTTSRTKPSGYAVWLVLPAILVALSDAAQTLVFQPSTYWAGQFYTAHESNLLGAMFLHIHPFAFVAFMLAWISVFVFVGFRLSQPWNKVAVLTVVLGHTSGTFGRLEHLSFMGSLPVFFLAALVTILCWNRAETLAGTPPQLTTGA
jgi:hypothetical protein